MKNFKIYLSAVAFLIAIGGVFASKSVATVQGYKMLNDGTPIEIDCTQKKQCDPSGIYRCRIYEGTTRLDLFRLNATETACDVAVNDTQNVQ